jgi:hypothetical protein
MDIVPVPVCVPEPDSITQWKLKSVKTTQNGSCPTHRGNGTIGMPLSILVHGTGTHTGHGYEFPPETVEP